MWAAIPVPFEFDAPVAAGQYDATLDYYEQEHRGHVSTLGGWAARLVIQSGPETGTDVYDWFDDMGHGLARLKAIATTLGLTIPETWTVLDLLDWMKGKTFTVDVDTYTTPRFQSCSRVKFDGYVALL